ncbi:MAG: aldo/keto reductase [Oscillatoriales cyanobacterium C42_A2020_001]|nr:aldo/keto reductase [Leptolyngbyaceae cyanobacterium C42_A2020_001]
MKTRELGTSGIQITPIITGTWQAGKTQWVGIEDTDTIAALRAAVDAGITSVDTAEVYGKGHSERVVGEALASVRDRLVYMTKVFANHLKYDQVIAACEGSLQNLKTDYIDLYQIHWPSGSWNSEVVPIEETMRALNHLKQQGKIRAIGVSNFSRAQLEEAMQFGRIDSLQPPYSLFWRYVEQDLMPYCVEQKISILAYSPLAQGLLTGRFQRGHQFAPEDVRSKSKLFQGENFERALDALDKLKPIAERHHTTLGNLALAWLIAQPQTNAIVGVRHVEQAVQNAQAAEVTLSDDELAEISAIGLSVFEPMQDGNPVMWNF